MKFIASSTQILTHLQNVSRVISTKNTLPILDNFLFDLQKNNKLVVTASDLESTIVAEVSLKEAKGEGSIAVPAKLLTTTLREFPEQPLTFEIDLKSMMVKILSDKGEFSFMGYNANEFPQPQKKEEKEIFSIEIESQSLYESIDKTLFATAEDELRPVMNGIFIEMTGNEIRFVSSDAHKLVLYKRFDVQPTNEASFILPKKSAAILKNILEKKDKAVQMEFDQKNAFFTADKYKLVCRLVEGNYPNYSSVIPHNNPNQLLIDRGEFHNTLRRVSAFSNPASNLIKLQLDNDKMIVSAQDIDFSISAYESLPCKYEGNAIQIGFKSTFLIEILSNIDTENIVLKLADSTRAGVFEPYEQNSKKEDVLMLLMPMMLNT